MIRPLLLGKTSIRFKHFSGMRGDLSFFHNNLLRAKRHIIALASVWAR